MTRVIALMALTTLGLSGASVHEPVHGRADTMAIPATQRYRDGRRTGSAGGSQPVLPRLFISRPQMPRCVPDYYYDGQAAFNDDHSDE
jgi:hypothetical protein